MTNPSVSAGEQERLARLEQMRILDTGAEDVFDRLTRLAASITGLPIALVSLVDRHRQWWKSAVGPLPQGGETPREISFCSHAIDQDELFEVPDARLDERFRDSPLVTGGPQMVHYAGMPLKMPGGQRVGTLCVINQQPGPLSPASAEVLRELAGLVIDVLAMRERDLAAAAAIQAERASLRMEQSLRIMVDTVRQMIWSATPGGQGDYYNARWYEFTGATPGSVDGDAWHALVHPEDKEQVLAHWGHSVATGQAYEVECRLRHASGQYRWILSQAMPMRDDGGTIVRWMGTNTDVHDRHLAEEMLSSADRRKDEFMVTLSHELRNPLSPISAAAGMLMRSADIRFQKVGEVVARQAAHMKSLVDDLMDVTRIKQGLMELQREKLDLREVVNSAVEQVWPLIQLKEHQLIVRPGQQPLFTWGDRVRLTQVVVNLVSNAAKYTPSRGLIEVTVEGETDTVRVIIRDNGQGIDQRVLPHVFELFAQEKRTAERGSGGLGVGLALVRNLCELHGGTVAVQSEGKGRGSTFAVSLPTLGSISADPVAQPQGERLAASRGLDVLIVDDNPDAARTMAMWLQTQGHRVRVETCSLRAVASLEDYHPQVFILDIGIPLMDGFELARRLRRDPRGQSAMLIAVSGHSTASDVQRATLAGFDRYLAKPAPFDELAVIMSALDP